MTFHSERLTFRDFTPQDYPQFASVFSNPLVMRYAYRACITDEGEMHDYFETVLKNAAEQPRMLYEFAVHIQSSGEFAGFADIHAEYILAGQRRAELGYFLLPEHWGRGYATEIARALVDVSFRTLGLHKVVGSCNEHNDASAQVMQKAGMRKEGVFRGERYKDGRWDDELRFGILKSDWQP